MQHTEPEHTQPVIDDTTQVTSPENGSNPQPGDPCHPLVKNGHVPLLVDQQTTELVRYRCKIEGKYNGQFFTYIDDEDKKSGIYYSDGVHHFFYWQHGNFSCDCNRARFLPLDMVDHYCANGAKCGETISIFRIYSVDDPTIPEIPLCEPARPIPPSEHIPYGGDKVYSDNNNRGFRVHDGITPPILRNAGTGGGNVPFIQPSKVLIRRLTPKEAGRLQGFPDGYLEQVPGYSDSKAYAAFGNSMTTNVMQWLGQRIDLVSTELAKLGRK